MTSSNRAYQPMNRGDGSNAAHYTDIRPVAGYRPSQASSSPTTTTSSSTTAHDSRPLASVPENGMPVQRAPSATSSARQRSASSKNYKIRTALGLHAQAPIDESHDTHPHADLWWARVRSVLREPLSEFFGVFVLVMFGDGSVAQVLLSEGLSTAPGGNGYGNYQSISWGWGIGTYLGIYVAGDSGAFLNPAITLCFCIFRGLPFRRWPVYLLAQFLGGFVAAGVIYANYITAIDNYAGVGVRTVPPAPKATAQIFATYPADFLGKTNQFFSEFITSALLMFVIFALKDESNNGAAVGAGNWFPLSLFFLIFGLGACFGYETGYAINLARDFGPRLMSYCVGYGSEVWSAGNYYFWVPIVASFTGTFFGAGLYDLFIYTGPESPINSPWFGIPYLLNPIRALHSRHEEREDEVPDLEDDGELKTEEDVERKKEEAKAEPGLLQ